MTKRIESAARFLVLAGLLPVSGCCTILTWSAAPTVELERLTGASVDQLGLLTLGVEMTDGHVVAYRETSRSGLPPMTEYKCYIETTALDAADVPRFDHPASAEGDRVEVPDWHRIPEPGSDPVSIVVDRHGNGVLEIVTAEGVRRGYVGHPGTGDVDWIHPGTWLCVVATPVTVAVDLVTFPVQAVLFYFFHPQC